MIAAAIDSNPVEPGNRVFVGGDLLPVKVQLEECLLRSICCSFAVKGDKFSVRTSAPALLRTKSSKLVRRSPYPPTDVPSLRIQTESRYLFDAPLPIGSSPFGCSTSAPIPNTRCDFMRCFTRFGNRHGDLWASAFSRVQARIESRIAPHDQSTVYPVRRASPLIIVAAVGWGCKWQLGRSGGL